MDWLTTSTILERLHDFRDQEMWQRFAQRFRRPLASFVRRFGLTQEEIDDVVQETLLAFAEAYRAGRYDRNAGRLSSWLFGIAYRQAANAQRSRARRREHVVEAAHASFLDRVPDESEAQAAWDADWEQAALDAALTQLRGEVAAHTFRVFELVVRAGRSPDEAAAELGMTRDAVYVAKHRVLKRLGELVREFEDPAPGG
ncbi:MAG: RNA polymerase sigma factor [Phycisphaerae bacterium]